MSIFKSPTSLFHTASSLTSTFPSKATGWRHGTVLSVPYLLTWVTSRLEKVPEEKKGSNLDLAHLD